MHLILLLVMGGLIGWLAARVMRDGSQGLFLNIVIGVTGSFIGNGVLGGFFPGSHSIASPTVGSLLGAFVGALILLAIVNMVRRGAVR